MVSQLAGQLSRIAQQSTSKLPSAKALQASFLFDNRQAADLALHTVHEIGSNGFAELLTMNQRGFVKLEKALFSRDTLQEKSDRRFMNKEKIKALDARISEFLRLLSPYFLLKPAHKALEWLIRRFRIHECNVDAVLECILPYHDSKLFVRMVQLIATAAGDNPPKRWAWLLMSVRESGLPVARHAIVKQCLSDMSLINFICDTVFTSASSASAATSNRSHTMISFYTATMVSLMEQTPHHQLATVVARMLSYIMKGLEVPAIDLRLGTVLIIGQLSRRTVLSDAMEASISTALSRAGPNFEHDAVMAIIMLAQRQPSFSLTEEAVDGLLSMASITQILISISERFDVTSFLSAFLLYHLIPRVARAGHDSAAEKVLADITGRVPLSHTLATCMASTILESYVGQRRISDANSVDTISMLDERFRKLLRQLASRYPHELDRGLESRLQQVTKLREEDNVEEASSMSDLLHSFVSLTFAGTRHETLAVSGTTLALSCRHADANIRLSAVSRLGDICREDVKAAKTFAADCLLVLLGDENEDVLMATLSLADSLATVIPTDSLIEALMRLLDGSIASPPVVTKKVAKLAAAVATSECLVGSSPWNVDRVVRSVLPHCVNMTDSTSMAVVDAVATAAKSVNSPFWQFTKFKEIIDHAVETSRNDGEKKRKSHKRKQYAKLSSQLINCIAVTVVASPVERIEWLLAELRKEDVESTDLRLRNALLLIATKVVEGEIKETEQLLSHLIECVCSGVVVSNTTATVEVIDTEKALLGDSTLLFVHLIQSLASVIGKCGVRGDNHSSILRRFFINVTSIVASKDPSLASSIIPLLFQNKLATSPLGFLASLWCSRPGLIPVATQARALCVAVAFIRANSSTVRFDDVVPCLLVAMSHPAHVVRSSAIACLDVIHNDVSVDGKRYSESDVSLREICGGGAGYTHDATSLINGLFVMRDEIAEDSSVLSSVLARVIEETSVSDGQQKSKKRRSVVTKKNIGVDQILWLCDFVAEWYAANESSVATYSRYVVLSLFNDCSLGQHSGEICVRLLPLLETILDRVSNSATSADKQKSFPTLKILLSITLRHIHIDLFTEKSSATRALIRTLSTATSSCEADSPAAIAVRLVTKPDFFSELAPLLQTRVLGALVDIVSKHGDSGVAAVVRDSITGIPVAATSVVHIMEEATVASLGKITSSITASARKKKKTPQEIVDSDDNSDERLNHLVTALEITHSLCDITSVHELVEPLFVVLGRCVESISSAREYITQLTCGVLTTLCRRSGKDEQLFDKLSEEQRFDVDLVVQCLRVSDNPQTHHHALALLSTIAELFPQRVLHSVMPVFTFMGTNILRQDDDYSFHLLRTTLRTVLPPLLSNRGISTAVEVVQVFVTALTHIPKHRRLLMFTDLVQTLGANLYLGVVIGQLLVREDNSEAVNTANDTNGGSSSSVPDKENLSMFCRNLILKFPIADQVAALVAIVGAMARLPISTSDREEMGKLVRGMADKNLAKRRDADIAVFDVRAHSEDISRAFRSSSLDVVATVLGERSFRAAAAAEDGTSLLLNLLEQVLGLLGGVNTFISRPQQQRNAQERRRRDWTPILDKTYDLVARVNGLLSVPAFVATVSELLKHEDPMVRRRALLLFNDKAVEQQKLRKSGQSADLFVNMTDQLLELIVDGGDDRAVAVNCQTALLGLEILVRGFGAAAPTRFESVFTTILGPAAARNADPQVAASALVCTASLIKVLGAVALPHLPVAMSLCLESFNTAPGDSSRVSSPLLAMAALAVMDAAIEAVPQFISTTSLGGIISALTGPINGDGDDKISSQWRAVDTKASYVRERLASRVSARIFFPVAFSAFDRAASGVGKLVFLLDIVNMRAALMSREDVAIHTKSLFRFYLNALCFREESETGDGQNIDVSRVENATTDGICQLILRLSETSFKPLFMRALDWATRAEGTCNRRSIAFYGLLDRLADSLKALSVPYFAYVIADIVSHLQRLTAPALLSRRILCSLHKCFLHDGGEAFFCGELNESRFSDLMQPLVDTIDNDEAIGGDIVIACLGQFAVAANDAKLWKPLNYQVLLKTRDANMNVRLAAMRVLNEFYKVLGEELLPLLPESVPFIAELMEDDEPEVEKYCKEELVKLIETFLGESLQKFF